MKSKWKNIEIKRELNLFISFVLISSILLGMERFNSQFYILALLYSLLSLIFVFLPQSKINNLAIYIIRITGFARYIIIPYLMKNDNIYIRNYETILFFMSLEIITVYFAILIYSNKKNKINLSIKPKEKKDKKYNFKLGLSAIIVIIIAGVTVIRYKAFLERYFRFTADKSQIPLTNDGVSILVAIFFLIIFIKALEAIKNVKWMPDILKIIVSFIISIFFINGRSITDTNVSRWSMIIAMLISYYYIIILYPNYKNKIISISVPALMISIIWATVLKVNINSDIYNNLSIQNIIAEQINYKNINAYFSGPSNVNEAFELKNIIANTHIPKAKILLSDVFANFPLLNKLTDTSVSTSILFNYQHYNSYIAKDQIIPLVGQSYLIFGIFFLVIIFLITYFSLYYNGKISHEKNFLLLYCYIYLTFSFALGNCINFTIMFQNIWIHVLPVYIIYRMNYKIKS